MAILVAVGANIYSLQREAALDDARARTLSLTADQGEYNDVRSANQLLISTEAARVFAYSTEVSVKGLIDGLNSKLSSGMSITDYSFDTANPLQVFAPSVSSLDAESIASFSLEVIAGSVAEIDAWVRELPSVDGVVQATLISTKSDDGSSFSGTVIVRVGETALLHRFDGVVEEAEPADESAPTNSPEPTSGTDDEENGS
nr:fimbrial assembly protein [Salinibacterium sp. PAMC 21357]